ncbi:WxL domain-containing protein [Bacillus sp. OAE603]|uniref:WxL domain-containing protein n=1 Tax=Gottfriedia sp. OAE603 TaxID=2663872 RepID=UPI001788F343
MKFAKIAIGSVLGITTVVGASHSILAATDGVPSVANSDASITFLSGTGPSTPVDPENPTNPLNPTDPNNPTDPSTGNTGPLTLDYVSSVDFGSQQISSSTQVYASKSKKPFIQVSDFRGTGAGWTVSAKASSFSTDGGTTASLPGAVLTFKNGAVITPDVSVAPTPEQTVTLNADGTASSKVVSAKPSTGMFTWLTKWFGETPNDENSLNNNVTLTIPAGAASVGNHEATVTWTLTDAPGQ